MSNNQKKNITTLTGRVIRPFEAAESKSGKTFFKSTVVAATDDAEIFVNILSFDSIGSILTLATAKGDHVRFTGDLKSEERTNEKTGEIRIQHTLFPSKAVLVRDGKQFTVDQVATLDELTEKGLKLPTAEAPF